MSRNIIETMIGAVVLLVAAGFVIFAFRTSDVGSASGYPVTAQFDNASGLSAGTEVRMAGVKIGVVAGQRLDTKTFMADVTFNIDNAVQLPADTSARIIPDGLLGGNFVALEPGADEQTIPAGGRIQFTQGAINVVDLLGRFIFSAADAASRQDGGAAPQGQ